MTISAAPATGAPFPPTGQLPALTGIRFLAVLGVVVTHVHETLRTLLGQTYQPLEFLGYHGWLAVELFFLLSGFTLTHAYGERLGQRFGVRQYGVYLWRRIARLWPVFAFTLVLTTAIMGASAALQVTMPKARTAPDPGFFLQQLSMTWMWFRDDADVPAAWNGPSWYVSVEFLACVLFPFLLLALYRLARTVRTGPLALLLVLTLVPYATAEFYYPAGLTPYASMLRVATFFTAGMLLRALVGRFRDAEPTAGRRAARTSRPWWVEALAPTSLAILFATFWVDYHLFPHREVIYLVAPWALCMLVASLFLARGTITRIASLGWVVALGRTSYGIFLGHGLLLLLSEYLLESGRLGPTTVPLVSIAAFGAYLVSSIGIGWLLWRFVEEPAGAAMNRMIALPPPTAPVVSKEV